MTAELVDTFYNALAAGDGDAMAACYHDDIVFEDPAFGELRGRDADDMWRMLCSAATDLRVTHRVRHADEAGATVHWIADYTFSKTGRKVHNEIDATMTFRDGRIIDHRDHFDFWKWASQALGAPGRALGWSPFLKSKVRATTRANLDRFQAADRSS